MNARTHARACRSRKPLVAPRPLGAYTRRQFVITAGSHGRICIFPRWLSVRQGRHLHPAHPRPDASAAGPIAVRERARSTGERVNTRTSAELWGAGTPTSWSSKATDSHAYRRVSPGRRDGSAVSHQHPAFLPTSYLPVIVISLYLENAALRGARTRMPYHYSPSDSLINHLI